MQQASKQPGGGEGQPGASMMDISSKPSLPPCPHYSHPVSSYYNIQLG